MNTEITDVKANAGWILYDGACRICTGLVHRLGPAFQHRGFECVPLQTPWVRDRLNLSEDELMLEMRVLTRSGSLVGGAAAVLLLARRFWWALPLVWLAKVPGVFRLLDALYRWGAARRYCANGACEVSPPGGAQVCEPQRVRMSTALVFVLPLCIPLILRDVTPWVFMWAMAAALWLALKIFTLLDVRDRPFGRSLIYLFAWPGMDAPEFFRSDSPVPRPPVRDWISAILHIGLGTALLFAGARAADSPLLAGWIGMIGIVLVLHFGLFKCLALLWRSCGIPATPLMDAPLRARSLSEFWGRRWNTGFSVPARRYLMEPIAKKLGTASALFLVFLVSGLAHELVISLPAKAGYGLPTLYFLLQATGIVLERRYGPDRFLPLICVAAPAVILFHQPFVHNVIIPFLNAIGAL